MSQRSRPKVPFDLESLRASSAECAYSSTALANRMGISGRQLQRLFSRELNCPPRTWLREERLQLARRMLLGSASVKEVALSLSFRHASQFCRDFRARFGYPPSDLTRRNAARPLVSPVARQTSRLLALTSSLSSSVGRRSDAGLTIFRPAT
jgi:transcriptional regulator GlxA family with amidase domain